VQKIAVTHPPEIQGVMMESESLLLFSHMRQAQLMIALLVARLAC
jgi:hypothetical protein